MAYSRENRFSPEIAFWETSRLCYPLKTIGNPQAICSPFAGGPDKRINRY
jgi:hypothetical protein